jgi:predicted glycoside hydrolase/deacetylase ChbG (UPF0249 family)
LRPLLVIINADDLGISDEVNEAIFDLLAGGRVTSATLLANGPRIDSVVHPFRHFTHNSFGAHLNLTEFDPLTSQLRQHLPQVRKLHNSQRMAQWILAPRFLQAVYEEWCEQIRKLFRLGFDIGHIDSHHHMHTIPGLFPVLKAVQRRFAIRRVRITRNLYSPENNISRLLAYGKNSFNLALRLIYRTHTVDAFTDLLTFCSLGPKSIASLNTVELMVHPGSSGSDEETQLLNSHWSDQFSRQIKFISYRDI